MTLKKVETIDFHPTHLDVMDIRQEEITGVMTLDNAYEHFKALGEHSIEAKTFLYDGRVLFCAGFLRLWEGVAECWMIPSIYVGSAPLTFSKILRQYVYDIMDSGDFHRLQTTTPDDAKHDRWMRFLGLKKEGILRKYTHNQQDYVMYARTR